MYSFAGNIEPDVEVKVEPNMHEFGDDDTENGFAGFENTSTIPSTADVGALNLWTSHATSCLIEQYKKYHSLVGQTTRLRSLREMFETISLEMQKYGFYFSPQKCENKWRVLDRKYKNLVFREKLKKPGRIRHYGHWEHKRALDEIFNEKNKHMYLDDDDFPPPSGSAKIAQKASRENGQSDIVVTPMEETFTNASTVSKGVKEQPAPATLSMAIVETFLAEIKRNFALAEANKERRHREKMAMRQSELDVQKKILKLKEQKMDIARSQMTSAAHYLNMNSE